MRTILITLSIIFFSLSSQAALVEINYLYNLNDGNISEYLDGSDTSTGNPSNAFASNFDIVIPDTVITENDTIRIEVSFLDGQRLKWFDDGNSYFSGTSEHFSVVAYGDESFSVNYDRSLFEFKDVSGSVLTESLEWFSQGGSGSVIISSRSGIKNLTDSFFDFSGFAFEADLSSLLTGNGESFTTLSNLAFRFTSGEFEILENVGTTSVPTPFTFPIILIAIYGLMVGKKTQTKY